MVPSDTKHAVRWKRLFLMKKVVLDWIQIFLLSKRKMFYPGQVLPPINPNYPNLKFKSRSSFFFQFLVLPDNLALQLMAVK